MFVLNKAHARAFQGRIHQKFSKGGRGQTFFRWRLKANKKRSRELLHFLDFYKNNEKVYEIKPKKKNQTGRRGGGGQGIGAGLKKSFASVVLLYGYIGHILLTYRPFCFKEFISCHVFIR